MKETSAKRREKAGGRDRDSRADKPKEPGPEPQDVEMPEEEAANAANTAKPPKELDSVTLDGKFLRRTGKLSLQPPQRLVQGLVSADPGSGLRAPRC